MKIDFSLGYTKEIVHACMRHDLLRNQAAYVLATAYWETGRTMEPVREAFWLSEEWRKANLRYYPWYGRGFVQLTWEANYCKAEKALQTDLTTNADNALKPDHSIEILVIGMREGWFTGKKLYDFITLQQSNYRGARRIINGTDKATAISEIARDYEAALLAEGYGVETTPPVVEDRRDGSPPRLKVRQSKTMQATGATAVSVAGGLFTMLGKLEPTSQYIVLFFGCCALLGLGWIARERLKYWVDGVR